MLDKRMIAATPLFIGLAGTTLFPLSGSVRHQHLKRTQSNDVWAQPTFHGILVGKSTSEDVIRTFGKPVWKGEIQGLVFPSDKGGEIEYRYLPAPDVDGRLQIIFRKSSGVVSAILLYPEQMTRADAITQFGADFEESNLKLGPCPTDRERRTAAQSQIYYGDLLVYRKLGLYVAIYDFEGIDTVIMIAYVRSCR